MPEINELPAIDPLEVTDDDLLVLWNGSAPAGSRATKVTRSQFLSGVARDGQDATIATVDADALNAPAGAIDTLTVTAGLVMGATLEKMVRGDFSITISTLASLALETQTKTVTGALVGDFVLIRAPSTLPAGLVLVASVSASDTVQIRVTNCSGSSIAGATYSMSALALRMS